MSEAQKEESQKKNENFRENSSKEEKQGGAKIFLNRKEWMSAKAKQCKELRNGLEEKNLYKAMSGLESLKNWLRENPEPNRKASKNMFLLNIYRQILMLCTDPNLHRESFQKLLEDISETFGDNKMMELTYQLQIIFKLAKPGRVEECIKMLPELKARNLKLKPRIYELLFKGCGLEGKPNLAFDLWTRSRDKVGMHGYASLLDICRGEMWERGKQVLGDIQGYVQVLDTLTLQSIKNWSKSGNIHLQTDLKALITGELKSGDSKSGVVCCLPEFKISEEERRRYTKALIDHQKKISPTRVKDRVEGEFESWRQWIEKRANEIEILIDTANCGFYMNGGEFSYFQANMMFSTLSKRYKVKLVLSQTRAKVEHGSPESKILDDWKSSESVYITPTGMNDDAFWMYGALWLSGLGKRILILSNDLLRDHHLNTSYDKGFFFFMTSHLMRFRGATNQHRKNKKRKIQCDSFSFFPPFPYSIQPHFLPSNQGILFPYMAESSSLLEKDLYKHTETDSTPALPETIANRIRWALLNLTSEENLGYITHISQIRPTRIWPMKSTTNDSNKPNINTTTSTSSNNTSATSGSAKSLGKRKRDPGT